ncbi:hypothetical protein [Micromonospora polyrhachis]|uniref:MinD-like ATPase involved in chromosome partitioning or flagellar assembly n=1 Tax=Micromonospora polyrhachis TaxID=1282883 RepID=A0A7W7SP56_9ACTN|nr:hypothetical protein [Micromonospora polyrhachis]MBB4958348.1 MinD-like ATPase involved in chromosome partitioning or flagellar assembly [Micromonospora polyrhachis]
MSRPTPPLAGPTPQRRTAPRARGIATLTPGSGSARITDERAFSTTAGSPSGPPRVVAFVAGNGGVGTTSTATAVALTLATLLPGQVALADTGTATASLAVRLGGSTGVDSMAVASRGNEPVVVAGVTVVDGAPWETPLSRPALARIVADLREEHHYTLLDVGNDASDVGHGALARADRIVVVTTPAPDAVAAAGRTLHRVRALDQDRVRNVVFALVDLPGGGWRHRWGRAQPQIPDVDRSTVIDVPWEPTLSAGVPVDLHRMHRRSRAALLRLAAVGCAD